MWQKIITEYFDMEKYKELPFKDLRTKLSLDMKFLTFRVISSTLELRQRIMNDEKKIEDIELFLCSNAIKKDINMLKITGGLSMEKIVKKIQTIECENKYYYLENNIVSCFKKIEELNKDIEDCKKGLCVSKIMEIMNWKSFSNITIFDEILSEYIFFIGNEDEYKKCVRSENK